MIFGLFDGIRVLIANEVCTFYDLSPRQTLHFKFEFVSR